MVHFTNVISARPLIIPQYLSRLRGQNLFHVAAVPYSGQHIREGNFLQLEIFLLQFKAVPAQ